MSVAGGADQPLARSGVPTPGGVRGRAAIGDRTRNILLRPKFHCLVHWPSKEKGPLDFSSGPFYNPAASYFPTASQQQYHRPWRA